MDGGFGKMQINLLLLSACTLPLLRTGLDRLRLGKMQINLLLLSACTIFALAQKIFKTTIKQ